MVRARRMKSRGEDSIAEIESLDGVWPSNEEESVEGSDDEESEIVSAEVKGGDKANDQDNDQSSGAEDDLSEDSDESKHVLEFVLPKIIK